MRALASHKRKLGRKIIKNKKLLKNKRKNKPGYINRKRERKNRDGTETHAKYKKGIAKAKANKGTKERRKKRKAAITRLLIPDASNIAA
jgi:hypothetical protein